MFGKPKIVVEVDPKSKEILCIASKRLTRVEAREYLGEAYELLRTHKRHWRK